MKNRIMQSSPAFDRIVERHMGRHDFMQFHRSETPGLAHSQVYPFVAISFAVAAGGLEVGQLLSQRLGWSLFEKEVLQAMAENDEVRTRLYAQLDERDQNWLEEMITSLFPERQYARNDYFHRLTTSILTLARKGRAVFVGRAADLILPPDVGLRVRITAPLDQRIAAFAAFRNTSLQQARLAIEEIEQERSAFIRHHFRVDPDQSTRFDLTVNMARFSAPQAVDLIIAALRCRSIIP